MKKAVFFFRVPHLRGERLPRCGNLWYNIKIKYQRRRTRCETKTIRSGIGVSDRSAGAAAWCQRSVSGFHGPAPSFPLPDALCLRPAGRHRLSALGLRPLQPDGPARRPAGLGRRHNPADPLESALFSQWPAGRLPLCPLRPHLRGPDSPAAAARLPLAGLFRRTAAVRPAGSHAGLLGSPGRRRNRA